MPPSLLLDVATGLWSADYFIDAQGRVRHHVDGTIPVSIGAGADVLSIRVGSGKDTGTVWLFGLDPRHATHVLGEENDGATLSEVNVVRSITRLGAWNGRPVVLNTHTQADEKFAVLVQKADGTILGAASNWWVEVFVTGNPDLRNSSGVVTNSAGYTKMNI